MEEYADLELTVESFVARARRAAVPSACRRASCCRRTSPTPTTRWSASAQWAVGSRRRRRGADQGARRQGRQPRDGAGRRRAARLDPGAVRNEGRHRRQLQAPARLVPAPGVGRRGPRRRRQPQPVRRRLGADAARRAAGVAPRRHRDRDARGHGPGADASRASERAGTMLLYCPIVRDDEIEASLAYLARRFDENTAPENFLRAMFTMHAGLAGVRRPGRPLPRCRRRPSHRHDRAARVSRSMSPQPPTDRRLRQPTRHRLHRPRPPRRRHRPPSPSSPSTDVPTATTR